MIARLAAWSASGLLLAVGMVLPAWSDWIGPLTLCAGIVLPFLLWRQIGGNEAWIALVVGGVALSSVLFVAYVQQAGCPAPGGTVVLKEGRMPVSCDEIRASYLTFAIVFAAMALFGLILPRARNLEPEEDHSVT